MRRPRKVRYRDTRRFTSTTSPRRTARQFELYAFLEQARQAAEAPDGEACVSLTTCSFFVMPGYL